jgi:acetoacetate decarboxylase
MNMDSAFPLAPWHLRGWGIATVQPVERRAAQAFVPPDCDVVAVVPGKTLGGLLFLSYESGSTLVYRELNVVAALVRVGTRLAFYLPRLYVDSPASLAGGQAIWGVPKEAAAFDVATRGAERTVVVHGRGGDVCLLRASAPRTGIRLSLPMPALGTRDYRFLFFTGRVHARFGLVRATVELPRDGELAALALDRPMLSVSLDALELVVPAPTAVPRALEFAPRRRARGSLIEEKTRNASAGRFAGSRERSLGPPNHSC